MITGQPEWIETFSPRVLREYALLADGERGILIGPRGDFAWMCAQRALAAFHAGSARARLRIGEQSSLATAPPYDRCAQSLSHAVRSDGRR